ncbi:hypothetical protein HDU80_002278 [Chytriomyces hyalinus]|nr:hypothetical protein HDU80_002278 [Chytriomyces hyalinus]
MSQASGNCKRELNFGYEQSNWNMDTWTDEILDGIDRISVKRRKMLEPFEWNRVMDELSHTVKSAIASTAAANVAIKTTVPKSTAAVVQLVEFRSSKARINELERRLKESEKKRAQEIERLKKTLSQQIAFTKAIANFLGVKPPSEE